MKKIIIALVVIALTVPATAQDDERKKEFDNKFRFGLRITPQPTWFTSSNKREQSAGTVFGFGFGLNLEYWFSNKVCLLTGIGGDFEGGRTSFVNTPDFRAAYWLTDDEEIVTGPMSDTARHSVFILKDRRISTTYVTIPLILKLSTQEYNGLKYFGMFGGELGYRVNAKTTDEYYQSYRSGGVVRLNPDPSSDLDMKPQTWFARVTFNAGLGVEYRLAGSTAVFGSVNYFRSLTNLMKTGDRYLYNDTDNQTRQIKSQLFATGIRINVGIMF